MNVRVTKLLALLSILVFAYPAAAQSDYPSRAVRILVPSSPGGGTDILARVLADHLSRSMGGQFFVENRPGAGQMIGIEAVARAAPDGYTLLMAASTLAINPAMYRKVSYDALRDFAPITQVAGLPNVLLVHPSLPVRSLQELVALAKTRPGHLTYASAGIGTSPHMGMELFKSMAGIDLVHVPFRGTGPAVTEMLSGRVPVGFSNTLTAIPHIEAGTLRALGVTGSRRAEALPKIPTIAEAGVPGYDAMQWYGLLAPAGTPTAIVERIASDVAAALRLPDVKERLAADGAEAVGGTPAAFAVLIKQELDKWAKVARAAGIEPQ
jgi:tripartite-type tricarboxylate transporter receptor subunit TctC